MKNLWARNAAAGGLLLLVGAYSGGAYALERSDITLRPYATSGIQFYDLSMDFRYANGGVDTIKAESNYLFLGAGATALYQQFYVDANFTTSLWGELDGDDNGDLDRTDFSIAAGYLLPNGFAVFGGYTNGNTDFDFDDGSNGGLEADGLFGGGSYKWSMNDKIQFNAYAAIAFLNGNFTVGDATETISLDSDTVGVSFGISASTMITDKITATGFFKTQSYTYDDFEGLAPGANMEVEETLTTLGVSVGMLL